MPLKPVKSDVRMLIHITSKIGELSNTIMIRKCIPLTSSAILIIGLLAGCNPHSVNEVKLINPPPHIQYSPDELVIQDTSKYTLVYGRLISKEPVVFSLNGYKALTCWCNDDCRARSEGTNMVVSYGYGDDSMSYVDESIVIEKYVTGFFWIDTERCCVSNYQTAITKDYILVPIEKDRYFRRQEFVFRGELIDLAADVPVNEMRNMRDTYLVRIDAVYLNLWDIPVDQPIETEVIGWIPPKHGQLYFWGEKKYPGIIACYISADPRPDWFVPTCGRYEIKILDMEKLETICSCDGCETRYSINGKVMDTHQGMVRTGDSVQFRYSNPTFTIGSTQDFVGTISSDVENLTILTMADNK